jgi:glycosyltransferase involved in cell wall biosynthesis
MVSYPLLQVLKAYGITTPTEVIPTGMEAGRFVPGDRPGFRRDHAIPQDRPVLLFVGRVAHEKNIEFLLKAVDAVRHTVADVLLVIAGEGPALESLRHEARRLGLGAHTLFIGYLDRHRALNSCYRAADVFVFASRTETQGLVLLEAMAQGVPVVSTAELGTRDVLREGLGVHIAHEDLADFSAKVMRLLNDSALRETWARRARLMHRWSASRLARADAGVLSAGACRAGIARGPDGPPGRGNTRAAPLTQPPLSPACGSPARCPPPPAPARPAGWA